MPFIDEFLLSFGTKTFKLQRLHCGDAESVGDVFDRETDIRKVASRRVEQRAALGRSAIRSKSAHFLAEFLQCSVIANTSLPRDLLPPLAGNVAPVGGNAPPLFVTTAAGWLRFFRGSFAGSGV